MKENKTQFFISDKPIDLQEIASNIEEPLEMPRDCGEHLTITFDCKATKETADWFKKQMEELQEKENEILEQYRKIAKWNARYFLHIINELKEENREFVMEKVIMDALCRGWNDCFDYNVKHNK